MYVNLALRSTWIDFSLEVRRPCYA